KGSVRLTPVSPNFAEHPGFVFTDPFRNPGTAVKAVTLELEETTTGPDGVATLPFDIGQYDNGIYRLLLNAEGFEASGGRGVKALAGTFVSSAKALVGFRTDGALDFVTLDSARTVRFLAIDRELAPVALEGLQSVLVERRYVSALVKQPNGRFAYQSVAKETELERTAFVLPAGGTEVALPTSRPGRFAIDVTDAGNTRLARVEFAVAGTANVAGNLERDAELDLKLDRRKYAPGDEILLEVTAPYAGTGLVTIERDRVLAFRWFRTETNNALARIRVPDALEGNAYVNVAYVRDIDSEEIFVSPLSYAVAPFAVDRASRRLDIDLAVPDLVRPGDALTVGYTASQPARLVLFAVDEGILQVADYNTPDPLEDYLRKKALQVDTHQMVDLILPDYDVLRRAAAPGGGDRARLLGANLNPFRRRSEPPVAYWSGILEADTGQREVAIDIPDYFNGELRVMAVGVGAARLGAQAEPVTVRGQIVLTPSLPLAAAPDDLFDVAVGVANYVEGSGEEAQVTVSAEALQRLSADGASERAVAVAEGDEGRALFRLRAGASPGAASVTFAGRVNDVSVQRRATLSVRPASAFQTTVDAGFESGGTASVVLPRRLHEAFADRRVTASASPLALADGLLAYLESFPHACAEQIVSKAFPQLGLLEAQSSGLDRQDYRALFRDTIALLRPRQNADGGFLFWSTSRESAAFPSVYITHFLTDARELGMPVPDDLFARSGGYLQRIAGSAETATGAADRSVGDPDGKAPFDLAAARTRAYAIYLMTRRGRVTTNYLNALQESLEAGAAEQWRGDIVSAQMAASHALLRNDALAERLIDGYRLGESTRPDTDFDTGLGRDALYVYLLARHFPERLARLDGDAVRRLVQPVFEDRFNTLSAAYTVLALGAIHRHLEAHGELSPPVIAAWAADGSVKVDVASGVFARAALPVTVERLDISGTAPVGLYYTASESGFDVEVPTERIAEGIELDRAYLDAEGDPVERIRVGDELTVRLRVRSTGGQIGNVAVTDLLPGGFEIVAESVRRYYGGWSCDYLDVREDRLVYYGSFDERMVEIVYRVKATSPGEFAAPAAYAAAMYHRSVRGRSTAGRLVVDSL
ncbi:MAG: alpha-2-macroglobulin family protein, partial [Gammaproteobacteria bacterium]|nr:alpha-2-macroglobulin family protein [Gammaproteobacteria bacterium]